MGEFKGSRAAIQSTRFAGEHFIAFLKLTATWAAISTAAVFAYCLITQPAGADASLGAQLTALDHTGGRIKQLVSLLPDIFGNLAVSVMWMQFVLLDREPRNPVKLSSEMGNYFIKALQIGLLSALAALPGVIVAVALGGALGKPVGYISAGAAGLFAVICFFVIYARLCIALPSIAVGNSMRIGEAFEVTKGYSTTLTVGLLLSFALPFLVIMVAGIFVGVLRIFNPDASAILLEAVSNLGTFVMAGIAAGYLALVHRALAPGDTGDQIAKQFE